MDALDVGILRSILSFVGDAKDFRSCEKANKSFQETLKDDKVWALCKECKPEDYADHPYLNKELALIPLALIQMKKWQGEDVDSVILEVLKVSGWKSLVDNILTSLSPQKIRGYKLDVRGDTLAVLLRIMEGNLHQQLCRANIISLHRRLPSDEETCFAPQKRFPNVVEQDLQCQNAFSYPGEPCNHQYPSEVNLTDWNQPMEREGAFLGIDRSLRNKLTSCLAMRAGIIKMDYKMRGLIWAVLIKNILELLKPGCYLVTEVDERVLRRSYLGSIRPIPSLPKQVVSGRQSVANAIRTIAPLPRLDQGKCCPQCRRIPVVYTLVPHHVEAVAKHLAMTPQKVLGDEWLLDATTTKEQAIAEAVSHYIFQDEDEVHVVEPNLPTMAPDHPLVVAPVVLQEYDYETEDEDEDGEEAYEYETDEEEESLADDIADEMEVNEIHYIGDEDSSAYDTSDCKHLNGFVPFASVSNIIF